MSAAITAMSSLNLAKNDCIVKDLSAAAVL